MDDNGINSNSYIYKCTW